MASLSWPRPKGSSRRTRGHGPVHDPARSGDLTCCLSQAEADRHGGSRVQDVFARILPMLGASSPGLGSYRPAPGCARRPHCWAWDASRSLVNIPLTPGKRSCGTAPSRFRSREMVPTKSIDIADTGCGIAREPGRIFGRFHRKARSAAADSAPAWGFSSATTLCKSTAGTSKCRAKSDRGPCSTFACHTQNAARPRAHRPGRGAPQRSAGHRTFTSSPSMTSPRSWRSSKACWTAASRTRIAGSEALAGSSPAVRLRDLDVVMPGEIDGFETFRRLSSKIPRPRSSSRRAARRTTCFWTR